MGSKIIDTFKCFIRYPMGVMRLTLGSYEQETIEEIKKSFPDVEVESLGYYFGVILALIFLFLCVVAYIMQVLYNMGVFG
mgnify:CR=1 FL=1